MTVVVRHDPMTGEKADKYWWMGQVIYCGGADAVDCLELYGQL